MYNQPTTQLPNGKIVGTLYKSPIDCLWKTIRTEGPLALYKGNDLETFSRLVKNQQRMYCRFDRPFPANCTSHVSLLVMCIRGDQTHLKGSSHLPQMI